MQEVVEVVAKRGRNEGCFKLKERGEGRHGVVIDIDWSSEGRGDNQASEQGGGWVMGATKTKEELVT